MAEPIIDTFRFFKTKTAINFGPPQTFGVPSEVVLSAARVTVLGQADRRDHEIELTFSAGPDHARVNHIWGKVPDKTPTIKGAREQLSRLVPGVNYNLGLTAGNFSPDEDVAITVEILALESTVAEVTRDVLRDAEKPEPGAEPGPAVNAVAFGFSEASFAHLMQPHMSKSGVEIGPVPFLKVVLSMVPYWEPWYPVTYIDVAAEELVIAGYVQLSFFRTAWSPSPTPVAAVVAQLSVRCRPAMVTTTKDTLQLQFRSAQLVGGLLSVDIWDPSATTGVMAGGYASIAEFEDTVRNDYLKQITTTTGALGFALPAYLETRPLPDYWHRVLNMRLEFLEFQYKTVQVHGRPISYLFIVFAMTSLGLAPPCFCEEPSLVETEVDGGPDTVPAGIEEVLTNPKRPQPNKWDNFLPPRHTDYTDMLAAAQVAAFGMSQQTFREAAKPYANFGHDQSSSTSLHAAVYASVRFWFRISLDTAEIKRDGIKAVIDGAGEGTAKAAVRDKCGHDVLSASERLRITLHDNSITWRLSIRNVSGTSPRDRDVVFVAAADAHLGRPDVELDLAGGPPPPLDQAINWVLEQIFRGIQGALGKIVSDQLTIHLIHTVEDRRSVGLRFVDSRFLEGEAAVMLGQLYSFWG